MSLKPRVQSLDEVPESVRSFYSEAEGGGFALAVEGMVPKSRLDEFRDTNIALRREQEELRKKFEGVDPEAAREALARVQRERDKKLIDAGKLDELVAERVAAMKSDFDRQLAALTGDRDKMAGRLSELVIDTAIRDAAAKSGVRATAIDDVLLRGRQVFRLADGQAVAMDGDKPIYGKAGEPMSVAEWVGNLTAAAPHLFEPSRGGGAPQGSGGGGARVPGTVQRSDTKAFLDNLDAIAAGKIAVV